MQLATIILTTPSKSLSHERQSNFLIFSPTSLNEEGSFISLYSNCRSKESSTSIIARLDKISHSVTLNSPNSVSKIKLLKAFKALGRGTK